ncbi:cyclin-dependent kinase inhibitor 2c-related [Anaeramoeba ignava]|uniref:Cyclin-dependent kinase inhibitor 2c-related n=1 Tax=Anaeramoeba ignava TaxID=1746090 RepID=A0A9Q0LSN9_ANAIG|nr:cyclin-dependent kinase inhibitor 2c-related [Anaeramoeba ignava]
MNEPTLDLVILFLKNQANLNSEDKNNPLHFACLNEVETEIIERLTTTTNLNSQNGYTPLHFACMGNNPKTVELLLKSGAKPNTKSGWTPLLLACEFYGNVEMVEHLIKYKAKTNIKTQRTPLHIVSQTKENPKLLIELLLNAKNDKDQKDKLTFDQYLDLFTTEGLGNLSENRSLIPIDSKKKLQFSICNLDSRIIDDFKKNLRGHSIFKMYKKDLFNLSGDAIVIPTNSFGILINTLGTISKDFFGVEFETEIQERIKKEFYGEILVGECMIHPIDSRNSNFPYAIIAPTARVNEKNPKSINPFLTFRGILIEIFKHNQKCQEDSSIRPIYNVILNGLTTKKVEPISQSFPKELFEAYKIVSEYFSSEKKEKKPFPDSFDLVDQQNAYFFDTKIKLNSNFFY